MNPNHKSFLWKAYVVLLGLLLIANFVIDRQSSNKLGATVYTTQLTDTIDTFRQEVNSSTANLNIELETVSGTVNSYGNIVSQNTPLAVGVGGTGTTTPPTNAQFFSASGSIPAWKTFVFGGGLLSTTTPTSVTVSALGFDTTQSVTLTGNWTWAASTTINASGTAAFNGTTTIGTITSSLIYATGTTGRLQGLTLGLGLLMSGSTLSAGQDANGHQNTTSTGGIPSCSATNGNTCTLTGNDYAGIATVTGGSGNSTATITFAHTYSATPACVASPFNTAPGTSGMYIIARSASAFTINIVGNGTGFSYICIGDPN